MLNPIPACCSQNTTTPSRKTGYTSDTAVDWLQLVQWGVDGHSRR